MSIDQTKPATGPSKIVTAAFVIAMVAYAAGLCVNPGRANDLFWQLRTGQLILANHAVPYVDTYSWTRRGAPWVAHEWLAFVLYWLCYSWKGFVGIWLLTAAVVSATAVLLYRLILKETSKASAAGGYGAPSTALVLSTIALTVAGIFFQPRPQVFTYFFVLVTLAFIARIRDHGPSRAQWLLVPIFALWANLHAGVLVGLGLLVLFAAGDAVMFYIKKGEAVRWRSIGILAGVCFLATFATPYTYREYQDFSATISNTAMLNAVGEWASPNYHDPFGKLFEGYVLLLVAGICLTRLRRDPVELTILVILAHEGLTESRNVPIFALVATVLMARHLQSTLIRVLNGDRLPIVDNLPQLPSDSLFGPTPSVVIAAAISVAICFSAAMRTQSMIQGSAPTHGSTLSRIALASIAYGDYPAHAAAFIEGENIPARVHEYNTYDDGGYLIWRLPDRPVFVDSRADVYFGSMFENVKKVIDGTIDWRGLMDKNDVDMIISPVDEAQSRGYLAAQDWALVYVDRPNIDKHRSTYDSNNTFIFIRRTPQYADLIARCRRDCPAVAQMSAVSVTQGASSPTGSFSNYLSLK